MIKPFLSNVLLLLHYTCLLFLNTVDHTTSLPSPPPYLLFGQSCPLSGVNKDFGVDYSAGILTAFQEINNVSHLPSQLLLQTLDDQYLPALAYNNTNYFVQNGSFFGVLGSFGTSTSIAALPLAKQAGLPFIGALTGTMSLRTPFDRDVINIRNSYNDEIATMVNYLVSDLILERISIVYQNDSFGLSGLDALNLALEAVNLNVYTLASYQRNTVNVADAMSTILKGKNPPPEAIIVFGTYAAAGAFIKLCKDQPWFDQTTMFFAPSIVNTESLMNILGANYTSNVIITQVVPPPTETIYPIVSRFRSALASYNPSAHPTYVALEGYILGRFVGMVVERMQNNITQEYFKDIVFQTSLFRMNGLILGPYFYDSYFNPAAISSEKNGCNQGVRKVWITAYSDSANDFIEIESANDFYPSCAIDFSTITASVIFASISTDLDKATRFGNGVLAAFSSNMVAKSLHGLTLRLFQLLLPLNATPEELMQNYTWSNQLVGYIGNEGEVVENWNFTNEEIRRGKVFIGTQTGDMSYRTPYNSLIVNVRASIVDEMYALVHYLIDTMGLQRPVLVKDTSSEAGEAQEVFLNELQSANITWQQVVEVSTNDNTLDIYHAAYNTADPPDVIIFVSETAIIKNVSLFLSQHSVWRAYTSLNSWEDVQNMTSSGYNELLYTLPLPNTVGNENLPIVNSFNLDYLSLYPNDGEGLNDPLIFEGYLQGMFLAKIISHMDTQSITGSGISQELSAVATIDVGGVPLGPFSNASCSNTTSAVGSTCECNQGMRSVYIYTINSSTTTLSEATRFDFRTCGVILTPNSNSWNMTTTITNIGLTAVIVALIGWAFLAKTFIF